jgi:hypothetical protein
VADLNIAADMPCINHVCPRRNADCHDPYEHPSHDWKPANTIYGGTTLLHCQGKKRA